jgi:prolipoprotein diacylglyceryltransferase
VGALFLMLHPLGHAVIELFRGDVKRGFVIEDVLSWSQFLAIPVFFAGVAIWLIRKPTGRAATPPPPAPKA